MTVFEAKYLLLVVFVLGLLVVALVEANAQSTWTSRPEKVLEWGNTNTVYKFRDGNVLCYITESNLATAPGISCILK